jgi:hypothetical protein
MSTNDTSLLPQKSSASEWRQEQEQLEKSRGLRAMTRNKLKECEANLSRLERGFTDLSSQMGQTRLALGHAYELLDRVNELLRKVGSGQ